MTGVNPRAVALSFVAACLVAAGCSRKPDPPQASKDAFFPAPLASVPPDRFDMAALQIEFALLQAAEALQHRAIADFASWFSPDFTGAAPLQPPIAPPQAKVLESIGVEIRSWAERTDAGDLGVRESAARFASEWPAITLCKLKIAELRFWEGGVFGTLKLKIDASSREGSRITVDERYDAVLALRNKRWLIQKLRRTSRREVRAARPLVRESAAELGLVGSPERGPAVGVSPYDGWRGSAAGDLDGDGYPDVVLVSPLEVRVFRNDRGARFADVTETTGIRFGSPSSGVLMWDFDNDGDLDVTIAQFVWEKAPLGQDDPRAVVVWRNEGGFRFTDVTGATGIASTGPATSLAAADVDSDGDLDLYVCMYGGADPKNRRPYPLLEARNGSPNQLWISDGRGRFVEEAAKRGAADPGWSLATAFADVDADGDPDLYVANDFGPHHFYRNVGGGSFEGAKADQGFGMGVSWGDYDNDGDLDAYVSNMYSNAGLRLLKAEESSLPEDGMQLMRKSAAGNTLLRNDSGRLVDATQAAGVGQAGWAWGNTWIDLDNDGRHDLYVVNGYLSGLSKRDR